MSGVGSPFSLPERVRIIAQAFEDAGYPIYLVGGAVRAQLMQLPPTDFDMTGPALPEQAAKIIEQTPGLSSRVLIERLGTLHIAVEGLEGGVEYTTFRTESYSSGHTPDQVAFTQDIAQDAFRRDFTCNALYQRALTGEIIDPTGGAEDIRRYVLRATRPEVMRDDGLRLLRMVRFAAQLRFTIEEETYRSADPTLLTHIARERIGDEITKILLSDARYDLPYGWASLVRALHQLREIGLLPIILPGGDAADDMACAEAPPELALRLAAWLMPLGSAAARMAIVDSLRLPSKLGRLAAALIDDLREPTPDVPYLLSRNGREHARQLCALRPEWQMALDDLIARGAPESPAALAIDGNALADVLGGASPAVGRCRDWLFRQTIERPQDNRPDVLLKLAERWKRGTEGGEGTKASGGPLS